MVSARLKSPLFWFFVSVLFLAAGTEAWAVSGIGQIAGNITNNLLNVAKLITAASYVMGMAFAVGAIAKFKQHKDAPTQTPLSTCIVMLFVGMGLIFIPSIFQAGGGTLFGSSGGGGKQAHVSGISSF